jgi:hypothetical protein
MKAFYSFLVGALFGYLISIISLKSFLDLFIFGCLLFGWIFLLVPARSAKS